MTDTEKKEPRKNDSEQSNVETKEDVASKFGYKRSSKEDSAKTKRKTCC